MISYSDAVAESIADVFASGREFDCIDLADYAVNLLLSNGRGRDAVLLPSAVRRVLRRRGPVQVAVSVPFQPSDSECGELGRKVSEALRRPVELEVKSDDSLIGGARVTVGDERFDCSLRGALGNFHL